MASLCLTVFVLVALLSSRLPFPSGAVPSEELERAISVLRVRGRALFANSITTSDILFDLLSAESLTLLAPTDAMLFDLDMTYSLPSYISTLRLHALPLRLPLSELRSLPNASSIPTFLPSHSLLLTRPSASDSIYFDGVQLLLPGIFYDQHIAVHGFANVLLLTSPGSDLENIAGAFPPMVDTPAGSPLSPMVDTPAGSPLSPMVDTPAWLSPSPEAFKSFFGRTPAEPPKIGEVSVSPSPLEQDLIVGDDDSRNTEF